MMRIALAAALLAACGNTAPPAETPSQTADTAPPVDAAPPLPTVSFGRYTTVHPTGWEFQTQGDSIAFTNGNAMIILVDAADQEVPTARKCLGYLEAFAVGVLYGQSGMAFEVELENAGPIPHGCRLDGGITDATGLLEAALVDLGIGGVALVIGMHQPDEGAARKAFDLVVESIALPVGEGSRT